MDMLKKYKAILKEEGLTGKAVSEMTGMQYNAYRVATRSGRKIPPRWISMFVFAYHLGKFSSRDKS